MLLPLQVTKELYQWCELTEFPFGFEFWEEVILSTYKVLIDPYDDADAEQCAKEDWERDISTQRTGDLMTETTFMNSLFELTDSWTHGATPEEYAKFLRILLRMISEPEINGESPGGNPGESPGGSPGESPRGNPGESLGNDLGGLASSGGGNFNNNNKSVSRRRLRPRETIGYVDVVSLTYTPGPEELRAERTKQFAKEAARRARPPKIAVRLTSRPLLVGREHLSHPLSPRQWDGILENSVRESLGQAELGPSPPLSHPFIPDRRQITVPGQLPAPVPVCWSPSRVPPQAHAMQQSLTRSADLR